MDALIETVAKGRWIYPQNQVTSRVVSVNGGVDTEAGRVQADQVQLKRTDSRGNDARTESIVRPNCVVCQDHNAEVDAENLVTGTRFRVG